MKELVFQFLWLDGFPPGQENLKVYDYHGITQDRRLPFSCDLVFLEVVLKPPRKSGNLIVKPMCDDVLLGEKYDLIINNKKSKVIEQEFRSGECHYSRGSKFSVAMSATTTWKTLPGEVGIYDRIEITAIFQGT